MKEDRVWMLIARKLVGEASGEELEELNDLLKNDPEINYSMQILSAWWDTAQRQNKTTPGNTRVPGRVKGKKIDL